MSNKQHYWFHAKKPGTGYGWGFPCHWKGWVSMALWISAISLWSLIFDPVSHLILFILGISLLSGLFIGLCYWKGEPLNTQASNRS